MGIAHLHTTIDYAALIKAQSNQVTGKIPANKENYKTKTKAIKRNYRRQSK